GGQKQRTRAVAHFNNTMGKPCDMAEGQQEEECNVGSCNQLSCWSDWTVCSQTCGGGIRARRNKAHCEPQSEEELCNVEACKATPSNATPSEAACVWGDWGSWSSCAMEVSSSCGVSRSLRMQKRGKCSGPALRERSCGTCDCFEQWQSWQACSALCGGGLRTRLRTIRNGTDCHGPLRENVPCNEQGCSCELTDWTGWSPCSGPCQDSKAVSVRTREPVTPGGDCNASMREEMSCDCVEAELAKSTTKPMEAVDCVWANWQDWEVCSASCGMGKTRRTRALALAKNQFGRDCEGEDRQTRECKGDPCPSCETSDWSQWSACTGPCEFSTSRSIRSREPLQQGDCDKSLEEERACSCGKAVTSGTDASSQESSEDASTPTADEVAVNCEWDVWRDWEACTKSCNLGITHRTRDIRIQANSLGDECYGETRQTRNCNEKPCPCAVGEWSDWSSCAGHCHGRSDRSVRTRELLEPLHGGPCVEVLQQEKACDCGEQPDGDLDTISAADLRLDTMAKLTTLPPPEAPEAPAPAQESAPSPEEPEQEAGDLRVSGDLELVVADPVGFSSNPNAEVAAKETLAELTQIPANSIAVSLMPNLQTNETVDCWYTMVVPADQAGAVTAKLRGAQSTAEEALGEQLKKQGLEVKLTATRISAKISETAT
ncbi:unnamed protein product, partial [Effrenium voratum]